MKKRAETPAGGAGAGKKVLVLDKCDPSAVSLFAAAGVHADEKSGLSEDQLCEIIGEYDAMVVRSATTVTPKIIEAGKKLKIIGRAGVGVDNINIPAATNSGIMVVNSPQGNTTSAAEHTWAMIMAMARQIPQAAGKLKAGVWDRKAFMGIEMEGRTLGVLGFGNIGRRVAKYGLAFGMTVMAYDPFVSAEQGEKLGVTMATMDEIFAKADVITLHLPSIKETHKIIGAANIAKMKKGVCIANVARGECLDEVAVAEAVKSGHIARAALDVFSPEPLSKDSPLIPLDNVILTPHLGASTSEAQIKVVVDVCEQIISVFGGGAAHAALNIPSMKAHLMEPVEHLLPTADKLGGMLIQMVNSKVKSVELTVSGIAAGVNLAPVETFFMKGVLDKITVESVNFVNAPIIAKEHGIEISSKAEDHPNYANSLSAKATLEDGSRVQIVGAKFASGVRILEVDSLAVEVPLDGWSLWIASPDRPGMIGAVGTFLGSKGINITTFVVSQVAGGKARMVVRTDTEVPEDVIAALKTEQPEITSAFAAYA
jgi:D-3-phosphoglycerate dehydrogenase